MSDLPDNAWLRASIEKMNRTDLLDLCFTRGEDFWQAAVAMIVPKIRDLIKAERRLHWDGEGSLFAGQDALARTRLVQLDLKSLGADPGDIDGWFGPKTAGAGQRDVALDRA